jgi:hypothetical protein
MIEALKFTFDFTVEGSEKAVYVLWHSCEFRLTIGIIVDFYLYLTKTAP